MTPCGATPMPAIRGAAIAIAAPTVTVSGAAMAGDSKNLCHFARPRANPASIGTERPRRKWRGLTSLESARCSLSTSSGRLDDSALAFGVVPDLFDESLVGLDPELDHDVDQQIQQTLDLAPRQVRSRLDFASPEAPTARMPARRSAACTLVIEPGCPELTLRR